MASLHSLSLYYDIWLKYLFLTNYTYSSRYMTEILPIWCLTQNNQSIKQKNINFLFFAVTILWLHKLILFFFQWGVFLQFSFVLNELRTQADIWLTYCRFDITNKTINQLNKKVSISFFLQNSVWETWIYWTLMEWLPWMRKRSMSNQQVRQSNELLQHVDV